eukprot:scaffold287374_cov31-Tisochrysis_lutea.AAC.2
MINEALAMPGTAATSETTIRLSDLILLKSRNTRKARSMRSKLSAPGRSTLAKETMPTATTTTSKMFHPEAQKRTNQWAYMLMSNSMRKMMLKTSSMHCHTAACSKVERDQKGYGVLHVLPLVEGLCLPLVPPKRPECLAHRRDARRTRVAFAGSGGDPAAQLYCRRAGPLARPRILPVPQVNRPGGSAAAPDDRHQTLSVASCPVCCAERTPSLV